MVAEDDVLVKAQALLERFGDWTAVLGGGGTKRHPGALSSGLGEDDGDLVRRHERTGHPLGTPAFVDRLERLLRRMLKPQKRGPKPKRQGRSRTRNERS